MKDQTKEKGTKEMRPILAGMIKTEAELEKLRYPVLVSYKYDGIRALVIGGQVLSRHMKPFRNPELQKLFSNLPEGTDGEIIWGEPEAKDCFRKSYSACMDSNGTGERLTFYVFDNFNREGGFEKRLNWLYGWVDENGPAQVKVVDHRPVYSAVELLEWEKRYLDRGAEGIMIRSMNGKYKFGRSSVNEQILLKFKRFEDCECKIEGYFELQHNTNPAKSDAFGLTERGSSKEFMVPANALGGFDVVAINGTFEGQHFGVGGGFTMVERNEIWAEKDAMIGRIIKVKYQVMGYDKPRFPQWLGFRDGGE